VRLGVRGKLFLVSFSLLVVALAVGGIYLARELRTQLENRIEAELFHHAHSARELVYTVTGGCTIENMDPVANRIGEATSARVTIIADDGRVLGDSERTPEQIARMENHADRPEVSQARKQGKGLSRRYSTTLQTHMLYVAVPCDHAGWRGVVRAAKPLHDVDAAVGRLRLMLLLAAALALGAAVVMSALASHFYSRTLKRLVRSAREVARSRDGRQISVPSHDEIGGLIGSINDMAVELQSVVTALAAERDRFEAVLEGMGEGVLALDPNRKITHANPAALDVLDLDSSPEGQTLLEIIRTPALNELVDSVEPGELSTREFDLPGTPARRILARATTQRVGGGMVIVLHDVTELRRLETVRQDFVANVSHELRTPVSVIRANTETLMNGALEDPKSSQEFLGALHRNAERLTSLINDLLDISRIDSGQYQLHLQSIALATAFRNVIEAVQLAAREKKLTIQTGEIGELRVRADEKALHQVLSNLTDNAVKYTPEGGTVTLKAFALEEKVRIEVDDDGPGIEPKHRDRIFERFYRVDTGRSREMGGTGLGLSIVKNLVETMGGEIEYQPLTPSGSSFRLVLPKA
jgi:two-component system, OmpR family, phosphate regulon sensor histidine kinase PhoR